MMGKGTPTEVKNMIAALYLQNIPQKKIRDMFNISQRTVRRTLLEKGLVDPMPEPIGFKKLRESASVQNETIYDTTNDTINDTAIEADTAKILTPAKSIDYSEEKEVLKAMICAFIDKVYMEG